MTSVRPRVLFHSPRKVADHGRVRWLVRIFVRRASGEPLRSSQTFRSRGEAWRFIEQSCDELGEIVA